MIEGTLIARSPIQVMTLVNIIYLHDHLVSVVKYTFIYKAPCFLLQALIPAITCSNYLPTLRVEWDKGKKVGNFKVSGRDLKKRGAMLYFTRSLNEISIKRQDII